MKETIRMISVEIRYFAIVRETLSTQRETLEIEAGATVADLFHKLSNRHPALRDLEPHLRVAVNLQFVDGLHVLQDGDEVALIPPVAGGQHRAHITKDPIDPGAVMARVFDDGYGATVTFTGTVRNTNKGNEVSYLEYEVYPEMAEAKMEEIASEIEERWSPCSVVVEHRVGRLIVGEIAIVIAVGAPHRKEAFRACESMLDQIKEMVPIWKREVGPDGDSWVGEGL